MKDCRYILNAGGVTVQAGEMKTQCLTVYWRGSGKSTSHFAMKRTQAARWLPGVFFGLI
jgi:hypothetical protein